MRQEVGTPIQWAFAEGARAFHAWEVRGRLWLGVGAEIELMADPEAGADATRLLSSQPVDLLGRRSLPPEWDGSAIRRLGRVPVPMEAEGTRVVLPVGRWPVGIVIGRLRDDGFRTQLRIEWFSGGEAAVRPWRLFVAEALPRGCVALRA